MGNRLHVHVAMLKIVHALVQQCAIFQLTNHITVMYNAWVAIVDAGMLKKKKNASFDSIRHLISFAAATPYTCTHSIRP